MFVFTSEVCFFYTTNCWELLFNTIWHSVSFDGRIKTINFRDIIERNRVIPVSTVFDSLLIIYLSTCLVNFILYCIFVVAFTFLFCVEYLSVSFAALT
jgi:hypothetical protein